MKKLLIPALSIIMAAMVSLPALGQGLIMGQEHAYDVYLRGNGEAMVSSRVAIRNSQDENMDTLRMQVPDGTAITELQAVQEIREPRCIEYETTEQRRNDTCITFEQPDYFGYHYYGRTTYMQLEAREENGTIAISLEEPIEPDTSGAVLLGYVTRDFISPAFGDAYSFTAKSLVAEERITESRMAIYADTDYRIRGASSAVDYQAALESPRDMSAGATVSDASLDRFVAQVGRRGHITKSAHALAPGDVLEVSGFAASSWWRLHLRSLAVTGLVLLLLAGGIYYWWRRSAIPKSHGSHDTKDDKQRPVTEQTHETSVTTTRSRLILLSLLLGLLSALLVLAVTGLVVFIDDNFQIGGYGAPAYLSVLQGLAIVCGYLIAFLAPAIFMGLRYGARWGILAAAFGFVWIITGAIVGSIIFSGYNAGSPPIEIEPFGHR